MNSHSTNGSVARHIVAAKLTLEYYRDLLAHVCVHATHKDGNIEKASHSDSSVCLTIEREHSVLTGQ